MKKKNPPLSMSVKKRHFHILHSKRSALGLKHQTSNSWNEIFVLPIPHIWNKDAFGFPHINNSYWSCFTANKQEASGEHWFSVSCEHWLWSQAFCWVKIKSTQWETTTDHIHESEEWQFNIKVCTPRFCSIRHHLLNTSLIKEDVTLN